LVGWLYHSRFQQPHQPLCRIVQPQACRRRVLGLANAPHFTMLPWPATPSASPGLASIYVYSHICLKMLEI
jgi:hypothetical protein